MHTLLSSINEKKAIKVEKIGLTTKITNSDGSITIKSETNTVIQESNGNSIKIDQNGQITII